MKVDLGIWGQLTRVAILLLIASAVLAIGVWYMPVIEHNERLRKRIQELEQEVRIEEAQSRQLRANIEAVSKDPRTIERMARERLGYARPDETVIRFDSPPTHPPRAER
jgi:cell division protein FtsB